MKLSAVILAFAALLATSFAAVSQPPQAGPRSQSGTMQTTDKNQKTSEPAAVPTMSRFEEDPPIEEGDDETEEEEEEGPSNEIPSSMGDPYAPGGICHKCLSGNFGPGPYTPPMNPLAGGSDPSMEGENGNEGDDGMDEDETEGFEEDPPSE